MHWYMFQHELQRWVFRALPVSVLGVLGASIAHGQMTISVASVVNAPSAGVDQNNVGFTITGLSGITRASLSPSEDRYFAVMDNSNKLITFRIVVNAQGQITASSVVSATSLDASRDMEDLALFGEPGSNLVVIADESPALSIVNVNTGATVGGVAVPSMFAGNTRLNFGFESVVRTIDGSKLFVANEEAITVDGSLSSATVGSTVRIMSYSVGASVASGGPGGAGGGGGHGAAFAQQWAYQANPLHGVMVSGGRSGLCALVALPDGSMLTLERSFALSSLGWFQSRIYLLSSAEATNVASLPGLIGQSFVRASKSQLYRGSQDNLEGLALGPRLGPGTLASTSKYALIGVVDDGAPISTGKLVSFVIDNVPDSAQAPSCAADLGGQGGVSSADSQLDNNDFVAFLTLFFAGDVRADLGAQGGIVARDSLFNNNDFAAFITLFFEGCP